ncbi:MAG: EamA family transporter [Proteobacteria bacterium]|nr:EamA family transporter [Pseudomonadota bacterium]
MNSTFLYLVTVLVWGSTWYAIKLQLGTIEPMVSVAWRFGLAALILLTWCRIRGLNLRFSLRAHFAMAMLGFFLFSSNYAVFYYATAYITTGLVAVTFSTIVIMNIVNGAIFLGNRVSLSTLIGAVIGITGIALIFLPSLQSFNTFGIILCFIGTFLASIGNIISAFNQKRSIPVVQANAWGMTYGAIFLFIAVIYQGHSFVIETSVIYLGSLFYLALFGSVLAFGSYLTLLGRVGPEKAAYATVLFPIVALAISTFLEGYQWTVTSMIGVILVLLGNLLVANPMGLRLQFGGESKISQ